MERLNDPEIPYVTLNLCFIDTNLWAQQSDVQKLAVSGSGHYFEGALFKNQFASVLGICATAGSSRWRMFVVSCLI
jgi:hypothetical protein